jgi:hypothetical protein
MEILRLKRRDGVAVDQALIEALQNNFHGQVVQTGDVRACKAMAGKTGLSGCVNNDVAIRPSSAATGEPGYPSIHSGFHQNTDIYGVK